MPMVSGSNPTRNQIVSGYFCTTVMYLTKYFILWLKIVIWSPSGNCLLRTKYIVLGIKYRQGSKCLSPEAPGPPGSFVGPLGVENDGCVGQLTDWCLKKYRHVCRTEFIFNLHQTDKIQTLVGQTATYLVSLERS